MLPNIVKTFSLRTNSFFLPYFIPIITQSRCQSNSTILMPEEEAALKSQQELQQGDASEEVTKKKAKRPFFLQKIKNQDLLKMTKIASIVVTTQEIACVTMTKEFELKEVFSRQWTKQDPVSQFKIVKPIVDQIQDCDLTLLEHNRLPPQYNMINLQNKAVTMMIMGMLCKDISQPCVIQCSRGAVGDAVELSVRRAKSRKSNRELIYQIVSSRLWKEQYIEIPRHLLLDRGTNVYHGQLYDEGHENGRISEETGDAFLQAIAFWEKVSTTK